MGLNRNFNSVFRKVFFLNSNSVLNFNKNKSFCTTTRSLKDCLTQGSFSCPTNVNKGAFKKKRNNFLHFLYFYYYFAVPELVRAEPDSPQSLLVRGSGTTEHYLQTTNSINLFIPCSRYPQRATLVKPFQGFRTYFLYNISLNLFCAVSKMYCRHKIDHGSYPCRGQL